MIPGKVYNVLRNTQLKDFSGLRYKKSTPTDIDGILLQTELPGFFEIQGRVYIFLEFKVVGASLDTGQRLALERLADAIDRPSIVIVGEHNTDVAQAIPCDKCHVRQYRVRRQWFNGNGHTVKSLVDKFLIKHGFADWVKAGARASDKS